jgi:hypothetical protein
MLLEKVDNYEQLSIFLNTEKLNVFSLGKDSLEFVAKYPMRNIVVHKYFIIILFFIIVRGRILMGGRSNVTATS